MRFRVGVCAPCTGHEYEVKTLEQDIFPDLKQYARASGLEVTFLLLSGHGGRFEESPASWHTVHERLEAIETSSSPITMLLLTGQDWGPRVPPLVIPQGHENFYDVQKLQQYYQLDTHRSAWHLKSEYMGSLPEVVGGLEPPSGLEHIARSFLTERETKSFWISRRVPNASSLSPEQAQAVGTMVPMTKGGEVDTTRLRRADAAHNNTTAVLSRSQRKLLEVEVEEGASEDEVAAAVDDYKAKFRRVLTKFLKQYIDTVVQQTNAGAPSSQTLDAQLHRDVLQHRADSPAMREDVINQVIKFTNFAHEMEGSPSASSFLVLHGASCTGKSTLVAHAVRKGLVSVKGTVTVARFIGSGCETQRLTLRHLLHSINEELSYEYRREAAASFSAIDQELQQAETELGALERQLQKERAAGNEDVAIPEWEYETVEQLRINRMLLKHNCDSLGLAATQFQQKLELASSKRPLLLVLCGLDRLDERDIAEKLDWLPMELPKCVRILITTGDGSIFDALRAHVLDPFCLVEVPSLDFVDNDMAFEKWQENHAVTEEQSRFILKTIQDANHPLYTQLVLAEAARWRSFDSTSALKRQVPRSKGTPEDMLTKHVAVICKRYPCEDIVHRILGYIALFTEHPLTEMELLDMLSLDNILLDLLATHLGCAPAGRMCDTVWSGIFLRLRPFLAHPTDRGLVAWCHDDIAAAACKFYLEPIGHQVASVAAEYVMGTYAGSPKPMQLKAATAKALGIQPTEALWRSVPEQALSYTHADAMALVPPPNLRVLNSSVDMLAHLGDWKSVLELYVCNFEWLNTKVSVHSPMRIVETLQQLDTSSATDVVKTTLTDLTATLCAIASETTGPMQLARQLLLRLPVSTAPLQRLRHKAELSIGKTEGLLLPSAPLLPVAELECLSVLRTPGWKCWWAGVGRAPTDASDKKTKATAGRLQLALVWLNAANRDMLRLYNLRTGTLFFERELEPIPKEAEQAVVGEDEEGDSYGIAGVGIGDNMKGMAAWSNGTVRVWALPAGEELLEFKTQDTVVDAMMSGGGSVIVTTNHDSYVVSDTTTGARVCGEDGLENVAAAAVARNGKKLAVAKASGGVLFVDVPSGNSTVFPIKTEEVVLAVALQDKRLAVSLTDGTVLVFDTSTKKQLLEYTHPGQVESLALSAEGWCASASGGEKSDHRIHLHDVGFGKRQLLVGHSADINSVVFHPSLEESVVSASHDGTVRLWQRHAQLSALPDRHIHHDAVDFVYTAPQYAVSASATYPVLHFWSHDGEWLRSVCVKGNAEEVDASCYLTGRVSVSGDGAYVVTTLSDHSVCCYAWESGNIQRCADVINATQAQFVNNGKTTTVAVASNNTLVLVDAADASVHKRMELGPAPIQALSGLPTDKYVVCAFEDRLLAVDTATGQILREFDREAPGCELVLLKVLMRNGSPWLMSYEEGTPSVILRSLLSGDDELALEGEHTSCAAVSANSRLVAICTTAGDVEVWDVEAGGVVMQEHAAHASAVEQVVFSQDGRWLLTAGQDTAVKCWDVQAGFALTGKEECAAPVSALAVTQGVRGVMVGLRSGVVGHLSLVPATESPRAGISFGESLLYNLVTTVERTTRSKAKAKAKPKRAESPSHSGSNASSATNTSARLGHVQQAGAAHNTNSSRGKGCCALL